MNLLKEKRGITLIALVITIIVLLILAGVSIATLSGPNGILTQANEAKEKTEKASVIEQAQTDILGKQAENQSGEVKASDLKEVLDKYFKDVPEANDITTDSILTTKDEYGNYQIPVSDIYNGELEKAEEVIDTETSYVGYYADIEGDGTVDGIIYADLAKGNTGDGQWTDSDGNYSIPKIEEGLKDYYVSQKGYEGEFGTKDVLTPTGSGEERFYIMALKDIDGKRNGTYYDWYNAAYGKMTDYATTTSQDFGTGKANTNTMIAKWDSKAYGEQDQCEDGHKDMWGQIKEQVSKGWFVPSRAEWSAFAEELGITKNNYVNYNLSARYWSSSQGNEYGAYRAYFFDGYIDGDTVNYYGYVSLSATF